MQEQENLVPEDKSEAKLKKRENKLQTALELANERMAALEKELELAKKSQEKKIGTPSIHVEKPEDEIMVSGIFRNYEQNEGGVHRFLYGPSNNIKMYELRQGVTTQVPLKIARHLDNNCYVPKYENELQGPSSNGTTGINISAYSSERGAREIGKTARFGFTPLPSSGGW
jgi:hypothetical protein